MADEEIIDHYVNRSSIADDTKFLTGELKSVLDLLEKINSTKVTLNSAKGTSGVADAAKSAKTAADSLENAKATLLEAKAKKELASATLLEAKARKENAAASILEEKAKKAAAQSIKTEAQARKENAEALLKGQKLAEQEARQAAAQQKLIDELSNDYLQLSRAYSDAAKKAKIYSLTLGENHPVTIEAVKDAKAMHDVLLRVDQSVGQSQRNVGNYKSAFDGLGMSFTQIARELPSLTISVQQFALAISNNLPMVQDEIRKAKQEIAALRAEGKETPSLFQRIGSSLISWQVGLSIGIALLTAYASKISEWVGKLFDGSSAADKAAKQQKAYNEVFKESESVFSGAVTLVSQLREEIELAKQGFLEKEQVIKAYNDSLGKTTGQVKSLEEAEEELTRKGDAYIQMTLKKAVANIALEKAAQKAFEAEEVRRKKQEEFEKALDRPTGGSVIVTPGSGSFSAAEFDRQQKQQKEFAAKRKQTAIDAKNAESKVYTDIADEATKAAAEIAKRFNLNFFGDNAIVQRSAQQKKFRDTALKDDIEMYKALADNQDAAVSFRLNARRSQLDLEMQILDGQKKAELDNLKAEIDIERERAKIGEVSKEELAQKEADYGIKMNEIIADYNEKGVSLERHYNESLDTIRATSRAKQQEQFLKDQEEGLKAAKEYDEKLLNSKIKGIQDEQARRQKEDAKGQADEISDLNSEYERKIKATKEGSKKREKVEREYAERRAEKEYSYALAELKNQIEFAEKYIAIRKLTHDVTDEEKRVHELRLQLSDLETKHVIDNNHRQAKSNQEKFDDLQKGVANIKQAYEATTAFISGMISASADREKNRIQEQIDATDKKKEADIEAVNSSLLSEQEKADKITVINAKAAAQNEALERRKRQLDLQKARFERTAAIGRIIVDTAAAVIAALGAKPWTPANIAQAIAVGAIGASQLAVAIATPLPKFKHGRQRGPATWGVTGDGGVPEVVASPDLKQHYVTPDTDTLTYLPKDWKVFPDLDAFQNAAMNMMHKPLPAMPVISQGNNNSNAGVITEIRELKQVIKNKPVAHITGNHAGVMSIIQYGNEYIEYVDKSVNF